MEPPQGALLRDGWWRYRPALSPLPQLRLTLSPYTADYRLCWAEACRFLRKLLGMPEPEGVAIVEACPERPESPSTTK